MDSQAVRRPQQIDIDAIMSQIRENVRAAVEKGEVSVPRYTPMRVQTDSNLPLVHSEELNYLNTHWNGWLTPKPIQSHRKFLGRPIVKLKRFILETVHEYLFKPYLEREADYQANIVRHLNASARYIDHRVGTIFWDLVKKIDTDITAFNERAERMVSAVDASVRAIEVSLNKLSASGAKSRAEAQSQVAALESQVRELSDILRGYERTVALLGKPRETSETETVSTPTLPGVEYLLLENRFRGSEENIRKNQFSYVAKFSSLPGPVLDLGCGRGEFLSLLKEAGISARGVDGNPAMVLRCREQGLDVIEQNLFTALENASPSSLGGVFAAQVVEHLKPAEIERLAELALRALLPGGILVLETINPQSIVALSTNFFRDPTHVWPIHPDTLRFVLEMKGFDTLSPELRAPYPESAQLHSLPRNESMPPRWNHMIDLINNNVKRLNDLLFGHQDYCVVGRKVAP